MLEVLHPLEVGDDDAAGVRHDVGDDVGVLLAEDLVGGRGGGAVRALDDDLAVHPVGVVLADHAAERRGDEDVAWDGDEVLGVDLLDVGELGDEAALGDVVVEGGRRRCRRRS